MRTNQWLMGVLALCFGFTRMAAAEVGEVKLATAHGIGYLPLIVMEHHKLFEKHAKAAGLGDVKLTRATIGLGTAIQDALLSGTEITSHFTSPPFQYQELDKPGIRTVLNSYDVLGGPATFLMVWTSGKFAEANPKEMFFPNVHNLPGS